MGFTSVDDLSDEQFFTVWHLCRMGIEDSTRIFELTKIRLHPHAIEPLKAQGAMLFEGPLPLCQPVRCATCGANINAIPCLACRCRGITC